LCNKKLKHFENEIFNTIFMQEISKGRMTKGFLFSLIRVKVKISTLGFYFLYNAHLLHRQK